MPFLTTLDLVILGGLTIGIWRGTRAGAIRQMVAVVGIVAAVWLGALLMAPAGRVLTRMTGLSSELGPVAGFLSVAVLVMVATAAVGLIARATLSAVRLGFVDRGVGGLFGGVRMAVVISLLLLVSASPAIPGSSGFLFGEDARESSVLYTPVRAVAPILWDGFRSMAPEWQDALVDKFGSPLDGRVLEPQFGPDIEAASETE